jgi:hypothetical protein
MAALLNKKTDTNSMDKIAILFFNVSSFFTVFAFYYSRRLRAKGVPRIQRFTSRFGPKKGIKIRGLVDRRFGRYLAVKEATKFA